MRDSVQTRTVRDAILDATDELLKKFGYRKMTIDDLAREVGIGKGTVYLHFSSKEEIALSHIDRIIERLKTRLSEIANSPITADQKIKRMLVERVMFRFDSVQHYTTSLNELLAQVRPRLLERRKRYFGEEASMFAKVLSQGKIDGVFHGSPVDVSRILIVATNALLPYSLSTSELGSRDEIEERTMQLADVLLNGIINR
jgi:AcrR family transcriptional regulator